MATFIHYNISIFILTVLYTDIYTVISSNVDLVAPASLYILTLFFRFKR